MTTDIDWGVAESATEFGEWLTMAAMEFEWWVAATVWEDGTVTIVAENPDGDGTITKTVALSLVAHVHRVTIHLGRPITPEGKEPLYLGREWCSLDTDEYDVETADLALQLTIFEDVIFG